MNIINDKVTDYINGLYRPLDEELGALREAAEREIIPIITRDTETLLLTLLRLKKPSRILEIGTAIGYSAACMARACDGCRIVTIEADPGMERRARETVSRLGLERRIRVVWGQAQEVLDEFRAGGSAADFDVVFIDAAKSHYRFFWDRTLSLCGPGAMIICDNVLMRGTTVSDEYDPKNKFRTSIRSMREFLAFLAENREAETSILPVGDGVSISILKG